MPYCPICDRDFPSTHVCPSCGNLMQIRALAGFGVTLMGGIILTVIAIIAFILDLSTFNSFLATFYPFLLPYSYIFWVLGLISALIVIVGGAVIYIPGRERLGGGLALIFSLLSIFILGIILSIVLAFFPTITNLLILVLFIMGFTMGIVGAVLGFARK